MKANCYHCGQSLAFNQEDAGRRIKRPKCKNSFLHSGADSQLEIYQPSSHPIQRSGPAPLPEEVAVELAEEQVFTQREARMPQREKFQWEREERSFNPNAAAGAAMAVLMFLLPLAWRLVK